MIRYQKHNIAGPLQAMSSTGTAGLTSSKMHKQQGQTSAGWTQCCRNNGIMLPTNILGMFLWHLTVEERSGGNVTNVQMVTCTAGLLLYTAEVKARAARSAQGRSCVSTILWPQSAHWLLQNGIQPGINSVQKLSHSQAKSQLSGIVKCAAMCGL